MERRQLYTPYEHWCSNAETFVHLTDISVQRNNLLKVFDDTLSKDLTSIWDVECPSNDISSEPANRFQKVWDTAVGTSVYDNILSKCTGVTEQARLKAAKAGVTEQARLKAAKAPHTASSASLRTG